MNESLLPHLLGVGLLALYLYVDVPIRYRYWACLALFLVFPLVAGTPVRDLRLAVHGREAIGTVLGAHCTRGKSTSMMLSYSFQADGVTWTGSGQSGQGNAGCAMQVNDPVYVSYLPREPVVNEAVRNPRQALLEKLLSWIAICLLMTWMKSEQAQRVKQHFDTMSWRRP